jgi:hypothetical protein
MTPFAAPLGILACLSLAGTAHGSVGPARDGAICYGGRDVPEKRPEQPGGCHAVFACAEHRKQR